MTSPEPEKPANLLAILAAVVIFGCLAAILIALTVKAVEALV